MFLAPSRSAKPASPACSKVRTCCVHRRRHARPRRRGHPRPTWRPPRRPRQRHLARRRPRRRRPDRAYRRARHGQLRHRRPPAVRHPRQPRPVRFGDDRRRQACAPARCAASSTRSPPAAPVFLPARAAACRSPSRAPGTPCCARLPRPRPLPPQVAEVRRPAVRPERLPGITRVEEPRGHPRPQREQQLRHFTGADGATWRSPGAGRIIPPARPRPS